MKVKRRSRRDSWTTIVLLCMLTAVVTLLTVYLTGLSFVQQQQQHSGRRIFGTKQLHSLHRRRSTAVHKRTTTEAMELEFIANMKIATNSSTSPVRRISSTSVVAATGNASSLTNNTSSSRSAAAAATTTRRRGDRPAARLEMSAEHLTRLARVADACRRLKVTSLSTRQMRASGLLSNMFVDDRMHYIYCRIGKVASTTWSRVLLVASGRVKNKSPNRFSQTKTYNILRRGNKLRSLASYHKKGMRYRLQHYFKFVFVRHPIDRMISAFNDRLKADHKLPKVIYTKRIIAKYRRPGETDEKGLRFEEFVRFMVDPTTKSHGYNPHWKPQYERSFPCNIHYDFIGHYETLQQDAEYVLQRIGADSSITFPSEDRDNRKRTNATERMNRMLSTISEDEVRRLKTDVYGRDFELFGYE